MARGHVVNAPAPRDVQRYTLVEIAEAVAVSKQAAMKRAAKEEWPFEEAFGRGGKKRLFPAANLPADVRNALLMRAAARVPVEARAVAALPAPCNLSSLAAPDRGQLDIERARDRILDFVAAFAGSVPRAIEHLNAHHFSGSLPAPLAWAVDHAWDKKRKDSRLNLNTLNKWKATKKQRGRAAPLKVQKDLEVKPWYGLLLALRQRPQGSCYTWIAEQIAEQWKPAWGEAPPSYHAIRRVCREKLSAIDQLKGRYTGSALRSHKHWHPRTADGMVPWQEVHADGWNTHFTAPHPVTGEFVTYEVWHFHDVATRFVPPPGIGLTETYEVITAGLERCVRVGGMMAVLQTDSTKVVKRSPRFTADPWAALSERAGFVVVHPKEVGNSQANGICENFNMSWLDKQARELATYQGKGMDSLSLKRIKKITEKMVKAAKSGDLVERDRLHREAERTGKGRVFVSLQEAEAWINAKCDEYNDRPHRSLPKIADPVTGQRRHQTPREALQQHINDGWQPVTLTEDHLVDLFRPHVRCKVTREAISPVGNGQRYHFTGMGAWNGQEVLAAIDPMDWRAVWVKTLEGEFLGVADLVQATGYRAKTQYEIAEEKRANAQIKRKTGDIEKIRARSGQTLAVPVASQIVIGGRVFDPNALESTAQRLPEASSSDVAIPAAMEKPAATQVSRSERPVEENHAEWIEIGDRIARGEPVSDQERRIHQRWPESGQGRAYLKRFGT